jgi:hypothetical protein
LLANYKDVSVAPVKFQLSTRKDFPETFLFDSIEDLG